VIFLRTHPFLSASNGNGESLATLESLKVPQTHRLNHRPTAGRPTGVKTLWTQDTSDLRHFGTTGTTEVSGHFGTGAAVSVRHFGTRTHWDTSALRLCYWLFTKIKLHTHYTMFISIVCFRWINVFNVWTLWHQCRNVLGRLDIGPSPTSALILTLSVTLKHNIIFTLSLI